MLEVIVFKKITFAVLLIILGISVYFIFIFDINNYKSELEDIISKKSNTEFRISGDLEIDLGSNTVVTAELLSVRKNDILNNGQGAPLSPIYHKSIIEDL